MKHKFLVNGKVSLVLSPENEVEKVLLKELTDSCENMNSITKSTPLGAMFNDGSVIINADKKEKM